MVGDGSPSGPRGDDGREPGAVQGGEPPGPRHAGRAQEEIMPGSPLGGNEMGSPKQLSPDWWPVATR
jgi:hypothetical protein